jgi:HK97 family phage prohead protease
MMGAIASHSTATSDKAWDGPAAKANLDNDGGEAYFKKAFAWQDPDADPDTKGAYKFIHHEVSSDGSIGAANLTAGSMGIGVLNGGRGGTTIPADDRKGVYNHLARHLKDGGKEPPELASYDVYLERQADAMLAESKTLPFRALLKQKQQGDAEPDGTFSGYASAWQRDAYGDVIEPGAFAQSIQQSRGKVPIFFNHDPDQWIGFSNALAEDHRGLVIQATLALDTSSGGDAFALLKAAEAQEFRVGLSIGFLVQEWDMDGDTRVLKQIDLWEVSITPFPAQRRAYIDGVKQMRSFEKRLRDVGGFSVADSKRILALYSGVLPTADAAGYRPRPLRDVRDARHIQTAPLGIREEVWQHLHK